MANQCLYEPIHGQYANCNGACKRGPNNYCPYYFVDPITKIINDWRKEAGVKDPIMIKKDHQNKKLYIYTTKPGYLIGYHGQMINKYRSLLSKKLLSYFIDHNRIPKDTNFIELVECNEVIGCDNE